MNIHSNTFASVFYDPAGRLLTMVWKKDSEQLDEKGVKLEIGSIIRYVKEYGIRNIIIDSRDYPFRENPNIQAWIIRDYMPRIMDSTVMKYAIIVESRLIKGLKDHDTDEPHQPVVDYFTNLDEAKQWIKL